MNELIDIYLFKIDNRSVMDKVCNCDYQVVKFSQFGDLGYVLVQLLRLVFLEMYLEFKGYSQNVF